MRRVEMVDRALAILRENRDCGILSALTVFASEIVFKGAIAGA